MDSKLYVVSALCFLPTMAVADSFNFNEKHLADTSRVYDIDEVIVASRPKTSNAYAARLSVLRRFRQVLSTHLQHAT